MGAWREYRLDPFALAVETADPENAGFSLVWKGGVDVDELGRFFIAATQTLFPDSEPMCRTWVVTEEGPRHFEMPAAGIAAVQAALNEHSGYIRFECWPGLEQVPNEPSPARPAFAAWTNRDQAASNLVDLQQCVGIQIRPDAIPRLQQDITQIVETIESPFFPPGSYETDAVAAVLTRVHADWEGRSQGATAAGF